MRCVLGFGLAVSDFGYADFGYADFGYADFVYFEHWWKNGPLRPC